MKTTFVFFIRIHTTSKIMTTLLGSEFNAANAGKRLYKVLNRDFIHNNLQLKNGLNVDTVPFSPAGNCSAGGIYFTDFNNVCKWLHYSPNLHWIVSVEVPNDAKVYTEQTKCKAEKIILHFDKLMSIEQFLLMNSLEFHAVTICIKSLTFITEPSEELLLRIVNYNGNAIHYIANQTRELCLAAVRKTGLALCHIKEQTEEMCLVAVQTNGSALQYVRQQTEEICMDAIKNNPFALKFVKDQSEELCMAAVLLNGLTLEYVYHQTYQVCLAAVTNNGGALRFVREQTPTLCEAAVQQNPLARAYILQLHEINI